MYIVEYTTDLPRKYLKFCRYINQAMVKKKQKQNKTKQKTKKPYSLGNSLENTFNKCCSIQIINKQINK